LLAFSKANPQAGLFSRNQSGLSLSCGNAGFSLLDARSQHGSLTGSGINSGFGFTGGSLKLGRPLARRSPRRARFGKRALQGGGII
jgi:hypothetical protein